VSVLFLDDGVYQLVKGQDTGALGVKNFSQTFRALGDYEVRQVYIDRDSLTERGLTGDDLLRIPWEDSDTDEALEDIVEVVDAAGVRALMDAADVVVSF
jgi:tRNA 2-thiouridine synthesizing protein C